MLQRQGRMNYNEISRFSKFNFVASKFNGGVYNSLAIIFNNVSCSLANSPIEVKGAKRA